MDQSQTYTSHPSHQAFLREYETDRPAAPVATGKLLGGDCRSVPRVDQDPGMATWATTKKQAAELLGLLLVDKDVLDIPMLVADAYGNFVPGPLAALPQYMTDSGGTGARATPASPVPVPANALHFDTPFLTDIAHSADADGWSARTPNYTAGDQLDATVPAGTYDDELLDAHFIAGDGRVNENIGLTAIHQVFHSEHDRLVDDIEATLALPANAALLASYQATSRAPPSSSASGSSRPPGSSPRWSTSTWFSRNLRARCSRRSTPSSRSPSPRPTSTRRSGPSSRTRCTASVTRC